MKHSIFRFLLPLLLGSAASCQVLTSGVQLGSNTVLTQVTPATATIIVGATKQFSAVRANSNGPVITACDSTVAGSGNWTSSNTAVATINISTGLATGIAGGTTTISCTPAPYSAGTATLTVAAAPAFTNPALPCTTPCPLTSGTTSVAYGPFLFTASGGTAPYTFSISTGALPTGLSLSSSGCGSNTNCAIGGTPSGSGTTIFTAKVTDSVAASTTLQMQITIAATACGPTTVPPYNCSTHSTANAIWLAPPLVGPSGCAPNCTTGINTTVFAYATCPGDFFCPTSGTGNAITRTTDANTHNGNSCSNSATGGSNLYTYDIGNSYKAVVCGGLYFIESFSINSSGAQIINNPNLATNSVHWSIKSPVWSRSVAARAWSTEPGPVTIGGTTYQLPLYRHDVSGTTTVTKVDTITFDWANCPGLPSIPLSGGFPSGSGEMSISLNVAGHETLTWGFGDGTNGSGQGSANWQCVYDIQTGKAATRNILTGQDWAYCSGNCSQAGSNPSPLGTKQLCPAGYTEVGLHNSNDFGDPTNMRMSNTCKRTSDGTQHTSIEWWQPGTNNAVQPYGLDSVPTGHQANGYDTEGSISWGTGNIGYVNVPNVFSGNPYNLVKFFSFPPSGPGGDSYGIWTLQTVASDTGPIVFTENPLKTTAYPPTSFPYQDELGVATQQTSPCAPNCQASRITPLYNNYTLTQPGTSVPTSNSNGTCFDFTSNWAGNLGLDSSSKTRYDVFTVCNLQ